MGDAIARWDSSENEDGLLFYNQGDLLKLTSMSTEGTCLYYRAYSNGEEGLVSGSMIDIRPYRWYWGGKMNKTEAEIQLLQNRDNKKFLIRESTPWCYYLSYKIQKKVYHFKITTKDTQNERTFLFMGLKGKMEEFNTISDLAWFVQKKSFYISLWWIPCDEVSEVDHLEILSRKYRKYSPNN